MKKKRLLIEDTAEGFLPLAIVAPMQEYRLCFFLNKLLGLRLDRCGEVLVLPKDGGSALAIPAYLHEDYNDEALSLRLFSNRQEGSYLVPHLRGVDFLLLLTGLEAEETGRKIQNALRQVPFVQSCFTVAEELLTHIRLETC